MSWCCPDFANHVEARSGTGLIVVYSYLAKSGKWFILRRSSEGTENAAQPAGSRIYFCAWCGMLRSRVESPIRCQSAKALAPFGILHCPGVDFLLRSSCNQEVSGQGRPKVINGRKPFRDDATESRCLTYRPKSKTRADVPVQLPENFAKEALAFRNRLLYWRLEDFETFSSNEPANICANLERLDIDLQPRTLQITAPLMTIALRLKETPQYVRHLLEFAGANEHQSKEALKESLEADLISAFIALNAKGEAPTRGEIVDYVREWRERQDPNLPRTLTPRHVGEVLRELGFTITHVKRGSVASINAETLSAICEKFGIESKPN
jgi:hypothetical protein